MNISELIIKKISEKCKIEASILKKIEIFEPFFISKKYIKQY